MAETDVATGLVAGKTDNDKKDDQHNQDGSWVDGFDDGLRKRVEKFKTPADLAKAYVEIETDRSRIIETQRVGLPDSPEGYELSTMALPEGLDRSKEADAEFKAFVHSLKLTKDQAKGLHEWAMKRAAGGVIAQREAMHKQAEQDESSLRTVWGQSFDGNQAAVEKVIKFGGDKFVERMNAGPSKDPIIRAGLYAISKLFADETLVSGRVEPREKKPEDRPGFVFPTSKSPELSSGRR